MAEKKEKKAKKLEGVVVGMPVQVHQSGGDVSAALITRVHNSETGLVNVYVIQDGVVRATWYIENVRYSEEGEAGTWRFLPKS